MRVDLDYYFAKEAALTAHNGQGPTLVHTRTGEAYGPDRFGWLRTVKTDEPHFPGAWFNENLVFPSENGDGSWTKFAQGLGVAPVLVTEDYTQFNGISLDRWTLECGGAGAADISSIRENATQRFGHWYRGSVVLASISGVQTLSLLTANTWGNKIILIDETPRRYEVISFCSSDGTRAIEITALGSNAGPAPFDILIGGLQVEDVTGLWRSENLLWLTNELDDPARWNARGTCTVTPGQLDPEGGNTAFLIEGLQSGAAGDFFQSTSSGFNYGGPWHPLETAVWMKRVSTEGFLAWSSPINNNLYGQWIIDLSVLGDDWQYLTRDHPAVSVTIEHVVADNGAAGVYLYRPSGSGLKSVYLWHPQLERSKPNQTKPGPYVPTGNQTDVSVYKNYYPFNYLKTTTAARTKTDAPCDGIQTGDSHTNVIWPSEDLADVRWNKTGVTIDSNVATAIDGSFTADRINITAGAGPHYAFGTLHNFGAAQSYIVISAFFKDDDARYANLVCLANSNNFFGVVADLETNTITDSQVGVTSGTYYGGGVKDCGNGIKRVWALGTQALGNMTVQVGGAGSATPAWSANAPSYTAVEGEDLFCWGMSLVSMPIGNAKNVPYISTQTAGAAVTRAAISALFTGASIPAGGYRGGYTMFVEVEQDYGSPLAGENDYGIVELRNVANTEAVKMDVNNSDARNISAGNLNSSSCNITFVTNLWNKEHASRMVAGGDAVDHTFYENGIKFTQLNANNGGVIAETQDFTDFRIGDLLGAVNNFDGVIKRIWYSPERFTEEQYRLMSRPASEGPPIMPGSDEAKRKKQKAIDAALWNKAMNARTREADSDGDFTPFNNVG